MKALSGKTAVVIGGGSGIGRGVGHSLSAEGMNIVVADLDVAAAQKTKDEIFAKNGAAIAVQVDTTNSSSLIKLAEGAIDTFQEVHVLINTVGVILEKQLEDITEKDWDWIWNLNVMSQIKAVQVFLPYLRKSGDAHIVITASAAGLLVPGISTRIGAYSTTKHALVGFAKNLRSELESDNIGVTLLCPSGIVGNLAETSARSYQEYVGEQTDDFGGKQPAGRKLEGSEVIGKVAVDAIKTNTFLASNKKDEILDAMKEEYDSLLMGQE